MDTFIYALMIGGGIIFIVSLILCKLPFDIGDFPFYGFLLGLLALPTAAAMYFIPGGPVVKVLILIAGAVLYILAVRRLAGKK